MNSRRTRKISKLGAIALCGCAVLFGLWLAWRARSAPVPFSQLDATEQQRRRTEVGPLQDQAKDIAGKARRHEKVRFQMAFTEEQINTMLQDRAQDPKAAIRDPRVTLSPGRVTLQGNGTYKGLSGAASVMGTVAVRDGQVVFNAESLTVSGLPMPGAVKTEVESEINRRLGQGLSQIPVKVESVTVEEGRLTVAGTTD